MAVWLIRTGADGELEQASLNHHLVTVDWPKLPDLSSVQDQAALTSLYRESYPDASAAKTAHHVAQLWAFVAGIREGDLVVLPLKTQSALAIGRVVGHYRYGIENGSETRHNRPVKWLRTDLPRTSFPPDLLHCFEAFMTVCQIKRHGAEERIRAVVDGRADPGGGDASGVVAEDSGPPSLDIERAAADQILEFIEQRFAGHKLATLVAAALQAGGYLTSVSPPGPDGCVNILAGAGPTGFDSPRLCVQVRSACSPADARVLQGLQELLHTFQADQMLLVSWGGFETSVLHEARQSFFTVRLWDSGDLLRAVLRHYREFPGDLQAKLPLKQVWALAIEQ